MYKGAYEDDMRHGYGEFNWTDGTIYKGQWEHGCQHGKGKLWLPDGTIQEGYFENNVFKGVDEPPKDTNTSIASPEKAMRPLEDNVEEMAFKDQEMMKVQEVFEKFGKEEAKAKLLNAFRPNLTLQQQEH